MRTLCLLIVLQITAYAQTSPKYHIAYKDDGSFTTKSEKWIAKRKAKSERRNGPAIAATFEQNMRELSHFSDWLDAMFDEVKAEFGHCHNVSRIDPTNIHITIEAGPFPVEGYSVPVSGVAYQNGSIHVVYWNVRSDIGPQTATALYHGELRNYFWWVLHGSPREMWGASACP